MMCSEMDEKRREIPEEKVPMNAEAHAEETIPAGEPTASSDTPIYFDKPNPWILIQYPEALREFSEFISNPIKPNQAEIDARVERIEKRIRQAYREENFQWFVENHESLYEKYGHKILMIHRKAVVGAFETWEDAIAYWKILVKTDTTADVIMQEATPDESGFTVRIYNEKLERLEPFIPGEKEEVEDVYPDD